MLKRYAAVLAAVLMVLGTAAEARTLKLSLWIPLDSLQGQGAVHFKELVEERSGGELEIALFPSNQLGAPLDVIDAQTAGSIEMSLYSYDQYSEWSPILRFAGLSFAFKNREQAFAFYNSDLHTRAKEEIRKNIGIRVLSNAEWNQGPYKILLSKDPILTTEELEGVPMRVPDTDMMLRVWRDAVGVNAFPIPWPEAPLALRQGMVRAIELPADFIRPLSFYENAKYLILTRHLHQISYMTISDQVWNELPEEHQQILVDAAHEAGLGYSQAVLKGWEEDQEYLKSQGVVIIDFDMSEWHERTVEIARDLEAKGELPEGLVDEIQALTE